MLNQERAILLTLIALLEACSSVPDAARSTDGPPQDLLASSRRLYDQYEAALQAGNRGRLASFYHPEGAVFVLNGRRILKTSKQSIDSVYTGTSWSPPEYFEFEGLAFDSLSPSEVIATGRFLWHRTGAPDTTRYLYAALLVAIDSGMAIRFEHETPLPSGDP